MSKSNGEPDRIRKQADSVQRAAASLDAEVSSFVHVASSTSSQKVNDCVMTVLSVPRTLSGHKLVAIKVS